MGTSSNSPNGADSGHPEHRAAAPIEDTEQLTAYLDGELTGEELAAVEQRLLDDASFRSLMQRLQSSWDMLDALPQTGSYDSFVQTTLELVARAAEKNNRGKTGGGLKAWLAGMLLIAVVPAAACWAGFSWADHHNRQPHEQLLRELPLIENFDRYSRLGLDIGFLESLKNADLFTAEVTSLFPAETSGTPTPIHSDISLTPSAQSLVARQAKLKTLLPRQLESIQRNKAAFDLLPPNQKENLANFHRRLTTHPRQKELTRTLISFYDWLKSLGQSERTELLDIADAPSRIEAISRKIEQQNLEAFGKAGVTKLPSADAEKLFRWYDGLIKKNKERIRSLASIVFVKAYKKQYALDPPSRDLEQFIQRPLSQVMDFLFKNDRSEVETLISIEDISALKYVLSSEANDILDSSFSVDERTRLILNWIDAVNQSRFSISPETLRGFYNKLSPQQRDELDNLSPADWRNSLIRMYRQQQLESNNAFDEKNAIFENDFQKPAAG